MGLALATVTVLVPDYESGLSFFAATLGFDIAEDHVMPGGKRWLVLSPPGGGARILLARAAGPEQTSAIGAQTGGRVGFFLETGDFARDHRLLSGRGVVFEEMPRTEPYGRVAVFRDPFGNRWDLIEPRRPSV